MTPAQVPHAVAACVAARAAMQADHAEAAPLLAALRLPLRFTARAAWRFAAGAVASRSMHFPGDTVGVLTPFADMHNYAPPPPPVPPCVPGDPSYQMPESAPCNVPSAQSPEQAHVCAQEPASARALAGEGMYSEADEQYTFTALRDYRSGDQVFLCYGHYTNIQLLQFYGFLLPENPHDEVHLRRSSWPHLELDTDSHQEGFLHPGMQLT